MPDQQELLRQATDHFRAGSLDQAEALYREILRASADFVPALYFLGSVRLHQGDLGEATELLRKVTRLRSDYLEAWNNLGVALAKQDLCDEAARAFQQAVELQPDLADTRLSLGNLCIRTGQLDDAAEQYRQIALRAPDDAAAHNRLGKVLAIQGNLETARDHFLEAVRLQPRMARAHSNYLMTLNYQADVEPAASLAEHRFWERLHGPGLIGPPSFENEPWVNRRLRIGYVSPDFRQHAAAHFIEPLLAGHDRLQFELFAYGDLETPDNTTTRIASTVDHFKNTTSWNDQQLADEIRRDRIDILVDLAGHSAGNRLAVFCHRAAPIQVSYLGYPHSTGLSSIDYYLTDTVADAAEDQRRYSERLLRLEPSFVCYAPPEPSPEPGRLPAQRNGFVTFGSLHALPKISNAVIGLWCRVLRAVPSARMLCFRNSLTGSARDWLLDEFARGGIGGDRLEIRAESSRDLSRYLSVYNDVDIVLDTYPWSNHVGACETLWMGVPIVTLAGDRHSARLCASVLNAAGLKELVAPSHDEFVQIASDLAAGVPRLLAWRTGLRNQLLGSALCDRGRLARQVEDAYRLMWRNWTQHQTSGNDFADLHGRSDG